MGKPMHIVVVMDPPSTVNVDLDTSFAFMIEAQARGHRVDHCLMTDLYALEGQAYARTRPATMKRDPALPITLGEAIDVPLASVDAILVRTDPPFDANYLWGTQILELLRGKTLILNDPRALRDANEKLYACHFPELMPTTLVTSHKDRIRAFLRDVGGRAVIKPLDGAGGEGVMALSEGDVNVNAIVESLTKNGRRPAMVQKFLPEVRQGDKRILLLDGEPLGAILRVPRADDVRSNIHVGGSVVPVDLDAHDRHIIATVAPRLRSEGLIFVGLDVIGGKLTEVNVTSPTGIQQMSLHKNENLSSRVIAWLEAHVHA